MNEEKSFEMLIQKQIDEAVITLNNKEYDKYVLLCDGIVDLIDETYGFPPDNVRIGLIVTDLKKRKAEYAKPTLHNILKKMKIESYSGVQYTKGSMSYLRNVIDYFHSCLALHYFEVMEKVPDELRVSKHE